MILLDLKRAYDTVWMYGLLYKLIIFKLPTYLLFLIKAFLEGRSFTVHLNKVLSSPKTTPSGLMQGAVLLTTLFALYVSDMPHPVITQLALYANDTAILAQSWRRDTTVNRLTHTTASVLHYVETASQHSQNRGHSIYSTPSGYPSTITLPTHCHPVDFSCPLPQSHT
jgi:hypothetical protein